LEHLVFQQFNIKAARHSGGLLKSASWPFGRRMQDEQRRVHVHERLDGKAVIFALSKAKPVHSGGIYSVLQVLRLIGIRTDLDVQILTT
jgi:hypothetical protein